MGSINIERYTADTYKHAPNSVCIGARVVTAILDKNNNKATDCIIDAWKVGFEAAYRAAKRGRLDFQQEKQ